MCNSGSIRLVNGSNIYEGRIEPCLLNQWGTVCDDHWDSFDAQVVCNQLGYPSSGAVALSNSYFGNGYGRIWLDDVNCSGSEPHLFNCKAVKFVHDCTHFQDAGVQCVNQSSTPSITPTPTPFCKSFSSILVKHYSFAVCDIIGSIRLVNGSNIYEGRVEVCLNNQWGTVCDDDWDSFDAQVVCNQLGYPSSGAVAFSNAYFGSGYGPIWLDDVNCSGSEPHLLNCKAVKFVHNCTHFQDAGVQCINQSSTPVITPTPTSTGNYTFINVAIDA